MADSPSLEVFEKWLDVALKAMVCLTSCDRSEDGLSHLRGLFQPVTLCGLGPAEEDPVVQQYSHACRERGAKGLSHCHLLTKQYPESPSHLVLSPIPVSTVSTNLMHTVELEPSVPHSTCRAAQLEQVRAGTTFPGEPWVVCVHSPVSHTHPLTSVSDWV